MNKQKFQHKTVEIAARRRQMVTQHHTEMPPGFLPQNLEANPTRVTLIRYNAEKFEEFPECSTADVVKLQDPGWVTWLSVQGLSNVALITEMAGCFKLHPLVIEEVGQVGQRPKAEEYWEHTLILAKALSMGDHLETEQVCIVMGEGFVITFEEGPSPLLELVRERLRRGNGKIREQSSDYIAYAVLDAIVDGYYPALDTLLGRLNAQEEGIISSPKDSDLTQIHELKRDLLEMRQNVWPLREAVGNLLHDSTSPFDDQTRVFMRDCFDHLHQIMEMLEVCRELTSDLMALYLSYTNNRTSEVMRVLTIIATLFMPLSFIASVYGMNFNTHQSPYNMPELNWEYGYPLALSLMGSVIFTQMLFFWKKGWIDPWPFKRNKKG